MGSANVHLFEPDRGNMSAAACIAGVDNGGYYGPFVDIEGYYTNPPHVSPAQQARNAVEKHLYQVIAQPAVMSSISKSLVKKFGDTCTEHHDGRMDADVTAQ